MKTKLIRNFWIPAFAGMTELSSFTVIPAEAGIQGYRYFKLT